MRESARRVLYDIGDGHIPSRSVTDGRANLRLRVADDHPDVADAGRGERLDAVEEHRFVRDRHELLGAGIGQRSEARSLAAAQDQAFHRPC